MPYDVNIGDGADALGQNQLTDALGGTYWVSGWDATLGTGALEVDIAAGSGAINGGDVSTGSTQTVDFTGDVDATDPRKAVISVDDTGTVQKTLGLAAPAAPTDEFRFRTYDPQPPTNAPGVVVAEVWLAAGATSLVADDLRDRRVTNDASINATPNEPDWVEDPNSPVVASTTEVDYTLANTYDEVLMRFSIDSNTVSKISLQANNNVNDNYFYVDVTGASTFNDTSIDLGTVNADRMIIGELLFNGSPNGNELAIHGVAGLQTSAITTAGSQDTFTSIDSIQLQSTSSVDMVVEVFGRNRA